MSQTEREPDPLRRVRLSKLRRQHPPRPEVTSLSLVDASPDEHKGLCMNLQGYAVAPRWLLHAKDVPAHAKWVYVALSSYVDRYGEAHPSHQTLAEDVGISVSSVQRAMTWLLAAGLVSKHERKRIDGGQSSNRYVLHSSYTPPVTLTDPPRSQGPTNDLDLERPTSTVDEVVNQTTAREIDNKLKYGHTWNPNQVAVDAVFNSARANNFIYPPDEHLDHYLSRMSELQRKPSGQEWVRWFGQDQAKRIADEKARERDGTPEQDDTGTPLSWRSR